MDDAISVAGRKYGWPSNDSLDGKWIHEIEHPMTMATSGRCHLLHTVIFPTYVPHDSYEPTGRESYRIPSTTRWAARHVNIRRRYPGIFEYRTRISVARSPASPS